MNELRTTLDTGKETYMALKCKQNDDRTLILTLLSNGVTWIPEAGSTLELRGKRSDSTVTIQTTTGITITNNVVTIDLSKEFTKIQGTVELELNIRKLTEITTFTFILVIEPSVLQDGAIVSKNTSSVLEELKDMVDRGNTQLVDNPFDIDDATRTIWITMKTYRQVIPLKVYKDSKDVIQLYNVRLDDEAIEKITTDYVFKFKSNLTYEYNRTTNYKRLSFHNEYRYIPIDWLGGRVFYITRSREATIPTATSVYADTPSGFRRLKVTGDIDGIQVYMNDVYPIQVKVGFKGAGMVSFTPELNGWFNSFASNLNQLLQHEQATSTNDLCILHNVRNISVTDISSTAKTWLDSLGCTKYKNGPTLGEYMMVSYGGKTLEYIGDDIYGAKGYILDKESVSLMTIQPNADLSTVATTTANGLMSSTDKAKLDGVKAGANKVANSTTNGNILIDNVETKVYTHPIGTNPHGTTKADVGLSNVDNTKDLNKPISTATQSALNDKISTSQKGVPNGIAQLNSNGVVPSSQLPSYVDDVLEYASNSLFPATGESGKIYINTTTNLTYRWTGSGYAEISPSIALGETSSTAYAGDKGKTTTDKVNGHVGNTSNPHGVTYEDLLNKPTSLSGYGIKDAAVAGTLNATGRTTLNGGLTVNGGTEFSDNVICANDRGIRGKRTDGTADNLIRRIADNTVQVGSVNHSTFIHSYSTPTVVIASGSYRVYHEGNKPLITDLGGVTPNGTVEYSNQLSTVSTSTSVPPRTKKWTRLATLRITAQYQETNIQFNIMNNDASMDIITAIVSARLKQQTAMGTNPYTGIVVNGVGFNTNNFKAIMTTSAAATTLDLYVAMDEDWRTFTMSKTLGANNLSTLTPTQPFIDLPADAKFATVIFK